MTRKTTQKEYEHVTLILEEADKHGLKFEVERTAIIYIRKNPEMDIIEAFTHAFNDWVK